MKRVAVVGYVSDTKKASCLPAEMLLDILHCVDYNTLVALCFTSRTFHGVLQTNAGVLAKRRRMTLHIEDDKVILYDEKTRLARRYDCSLPFTYVVALRVVASHVGFHNLATLHITNDWRRMPIDRLLYAAPALRFVETLHIAIAELSSSGITRVEEVNRFTEKFPRLRRLCLGADGKPSFDWPAFLRSDGALKLPELVAGLLSNFSTKEHGPSVPNERDFLRYCFDCTRIAGNVGKFVSLPFDLDVSRSFLETSLRRIAKEDRTLTVQFRMTEEPNLSTDKFSVEQKEEYGRPVTHYTSRNSTLSVYQQQGFFTVTNDPSFDLFDIVP